METPNPDTDNVLLCLNPDDNVLVLTKSMSAGSSFRLGDRTFQLEKPLGLGHKIASRPIPSGEKIYKYGAPIGSATRDIYPGEHVHLHNMKSEYIPTLHPHPALPLQGEG